MQALLYNVFVAPLMQLYGALFEYPSLVLGEGGCIIAFSLALNLLLMPIYAQMERKSRAGVALRERVGRDVARIRKFFHGRERYFYVRAVHRQHGYRPIAHLLGSADLMVQIIVFATVYHYLSTHEALAGAAFGPLRDLGKPDGLLGGVNVLPLIMTAINAAAVYSYVDDKGRRMQALGLAAIFLVLLYGSASGLVLYWTTNNLFSLIRSQIRRRLVAESATKSPQWLATLRRQS